MARGPHAGPAFVALIAVLCVLGCAQPAGKTTVVVSVVPQATFVERIAGDLVHAEVMIPPGASPHTFEPTMAQMQAVSRAQAWLRVGHPALVFERDWESRFRAANAGLRVIDGFAAETNHGSRVDSPGHEEAHHGTNAGAREGAHSHDPHVWVSPKVAARLARVTADALVELLPQHADLFQDNLTELLGEIDALDAELQRTLENYRGRRFLVQHPSWGYFAEDYGLIQTAIEEGEKEPGPRRLAELVELARREHLRVVFAQPQESRRGAETLMRDVGGDVVLLDPLAPDWFDNLRRVGEKLRDAFQQADAAAQG